MEDLEPAARQALQDRFEVMLLEMTQWSWTDREDKEWLAAAQLLGFDTNFLEVLDKERRYGVAQRNWEHYQRWLKERNPARAELEAKWGMDTKHAMHLVRLLRTCRELLTEGVLRVRRPDAEELLSIRAGAWSYEKLIDYAESEDASLGELAKTSKLPKYPNRKKIDEVCIRVVESQL